jgi:hypothetical protein
MGLKFNPFSGNFDFTGSGGGGGGSSYIDGEVQNFSALPQTIGSPAVDSAYLVREAEGAWLLSRKPAGIYIRTDDTGVRADDWTYAGEFPDVFNDANLVVYANADSTKNVKFDVSAVTAGTTRTITVPDANVTLPNQGTSTGDSPTFAQVTINDTVNDVSTLTLANDAGANIIEFEAQELSLNHTGGNDTPYISVSDGVDEALLGLRQGEMFLQGSNPVVRIEKGGGALADIKVNKLVLEDATTAGDFTATFDPDANLSANRTYDLPDASGTIALNPMTTAGDIVVGGTSGAPARLALGTAAQQLRVNSGATSLEYFTPSAGGTKTYAVFTAEHNQPTATAFATLDTRNSIAVLDFDDASTESAVFVGILPEAASLGSGLIVSLRWMATTATSGDVRWSVAWEKSNTDLDSDSFDTATAATATTNGTSGIVTVTNITCTTIDSLAAGDLFRLRVQRIGGDAADTMNSSDAELVAVEVRSAA